MPNKLPLKIIASWLLVFIWMGIIFYSSSLPASTIPNLFPLQDIIFHILVYLMLAFFLSYALKNTYNLSLIVITIITIIFGVIYGIINEWYQGFIPGRQSSSFDVIIDGIGSFTGNIFYTFLKYKGEINWPR